MEGRKHHVGQRESSISALSWLLFRSLRAPNEELLSGGKTPLSSQSSCWRIISVLGSLVFLVGILVVMMMLAQLPVILECSDWLGYTDKE